MEEENQIMTITDMTSASLEPLWQSTLGWQPNATQTDLFQQLYLKLTTANKFLNLTRITEPAEFWEKHLWDSLRGVQDWLGQAAGQALGQPLEQALAPLAPQSVIDIGTGGGFPGLPIAIACPTWKVTLLDSTRKKINFIQQAATEMGLQDVVGLSDRVEVLGQHPKYREQFDIATIRAVATASVCAEYALPMVKVGGMAILYRGQWTEAESAELAAAVAQLGGAIAKIDEFTTPLSAGARTCIYLRKVAATDRQYPRAVGIPTQKPL
jgi:16S rRNA (guanine527-N7)-methyltransferase